MIHLKTPEELQLMIRAGKIAGQVLEQVVSAAKPGVSTLDLDQLAEKLILASGGEAGFKTVSNYAHTICTNINSQVVHGIPKDIALKDGDILSIDLGATYQGWHSDTAITIPIGDVHQETKQFLATGQKALYAGIAQAQVGAKVGDISSAIEQVLSEGKYGIVESLTGHGVGLELHEEPLIPNLGDPGTGLELTEGMVIAIEPIYTNGSPEVYLEEDGWTISSENASLAGLFEHTVAITSDGPKILTKRPAETIS